MSAAADRHLVAVPAVTRSVFHVSTSSAMLAGVYDGDVTIHELLEHGDFAIGSFNELEGELIALDGTCYRSHPDGSLSVAEPDDLTCFTAATHFEPAASIEVSTPMDQAALRSFIDARLPSLNLTYAIRITGAFEVVESRTTRKQDKPYPRMIDTVAGQALTTFTSVSGTLLGFRTPEYQAAISVAGYHLHFIDNHHTRGGHVLDYRLTSGAIEICPTTDLHLHVPRTGTHLDAELSTTDLHAQVRSVEE